MITAEPLTVAKTRELLGAESEGMSDAQISVVIERAREVAGLINRAFDYGRRVTSSRSRKDQPHG